MDRKNFGRAPFSYYFIGGIFQAVNLNAIFKCIAVGSEFSYRRSQPESTGMNDRSEGGYARRNRVDAVSA